MKLDGYVEQFGDGAKGSVVVEPVFIWAEAMRSPAFWILLAFTALAYPVQSGVSLY